MRKKIVAGNWKMNTNLNQAIELVNSIISKQSCQEAQLIICPPFPFINSVVNLCSSNSIGIGAQNCNQNPKGAYTGEVSAEMLKSLGVQYVIIGHSERRQYFNESNSEIAMKVDRAFENELIPIFCCGELLEDRNNNRHFDVVKTQIEESLFHLNVTQIKKIIVAYEPVWAIGTGVTASPAQAQEMHQHIRLLFNSKYGEEISSIISILYGGSCNAQNASELFNLPDVDGGLIGGASLKVDDFIAISNSFPKV